MQSIRSTPLPADGLAHQPGPPPLVFPCEAEMPETKAHFEQRTSLFLLLRLYLDEVLASGGPPACLGSDQFVYWDPTDPGKSLAPDLFVRLGAEERLFESWMTWEHGAPHLAVEIISRYDRGDLRWQPKLSSYEASGIEELVRYDSARPAGQRLRIWDRVDHRLVERVMTAPGARRCRTLALWWVEAMMPAGAKGRWPALRLALDEPGGRLLPTLDEARRREQQRAEELAEKGRQETARARAQAEQARAQVERAEAEVARLRALLAESRGTPGEE